MPRIGLDQAMFTYLLTYKKGQVALAGQEGGMRGGRETEDPGRGSLLTSFSPYAFGLAGAPPRAVVTRK